METTSANNLISLDVSEPLWTHFFMVSPLVVIGTREGDRYNFAPKHMAMPVGWDNYFAFVCTRKHATYRNIRDHGFFTVSFPKPSQVIVASMTAEPRCGDDEEKPSLEKLPTLPARHINGRFLQDAYLFFECKMERIIDGFGKYSIIIGFIEAAHVDERYLRGADTDDAETIHSNPLLAYLSPGRYASISSSTAFPIPPGMKQ